MSTVKDAVVVKGTLFWPFLNRHNPMSEKYSVDLGQLDKSEAKKLSSIGIEVKKDEPKDDKPDRGNYVSLKAIYPPKVFDTKKRGVDGGIVGNGTIANVRVTAYEWSYGKKSGVGAGFNKVQVVELVEYEGRSDEEDGFEFDEDAEDQDDAQSEFEFDDNVDDIE